MKNLLFPLLTLSSLLILLLPFTPGNNLFIASHVFLLDPALWGVCRSFALVVAHGLCSSGLFCLSNISYERFGRRSLLVNKGLINLMPRMAYGSGIIW